MPPLLWVLTGIASVLGYKWMSDKDQQEKRDLEDRIRRQNDEISILRQEVEKTKVLNEKAVKIIGDHYDPREDE